MRKYVFNDGHEITSKLGAKEIIARMDRLDTLRVLVEGYDDGVGLSIYDKVVRAYNKSDNFTGIIRLTGTEKDFLSYLLDNDMLDPDDRNVIEWYC